MKHFQIRAYRAKEDTEKAVLPTIIFVRIVDSPLVGINIVFGWWDFGVSFLFAFQQKRA